MDIDMTGIVDGFSMRCEIKRESKKDLNFLPV